MFDLFHYEFMRNALCAGFLASIACGIIGTYVLVRKMVFVSGGLAHSAFGGMGIAFYLRLDPVIGAIVFSVLCALGLGTISRKTGHSEDTAIGIIWPLGMAIGILFLSMSSGYVPDLMSYLFGNILMVASKDLWLMCVLDAVIVLTVLCFFKEFQALCFDEEFARINGVKVNALSLLLLVLISFSVVLLIRVVGIILVIALLTMPAAVSRFYMGSLQKNMLLSMLLSFCFIVFGLLGSYYWDVPSGALIIIIGASVFGLASLQQRIFGKS